MSFKKIAVLGLVFVSTGCGNGNPAATPATASQAQTAGGPINGNWVALSVSCNGLAEQAGSSTETLSLNINSATGTLTAATSGCTETVSINVSYPSAGQVVLQYTNTTFSPAGCGSGSANGTSLPAYSYVLNTAANSLILSSNNDPSCPGGSYIADFSK